MHLTERKTEIEHIEYIANAQQSYSQLIEYYAKGVACHGHAAQVVQIEGSAWPWGLKSLKIMVRMKCLISFQQKKLAERG
jgi:hypothetical protein